MHNTEFTGLGSIQQQSPLDTLSNSDLSSINPNISNPQGGEYPGVIVRAPLNKRTFQGTMEQTNDIEHENNSNKRQQLDGQAPSRVLLLRNLARGVTELDISSFVQPFTHHTPKVYLHASASQAFVEFPDEEACVHAYQYFSQHPIMLKGSSVQVTFSRRDQVTTLEEKGDIQTKVLLVTISNLVYNTNVPLIKLLFSKHGTVDKVLALQNNSSRSPTQHNQYLVQFSKISEAREAIRNLHNRNIYQGCNTLGLQPSKHVEITVKNNTPHSWDYTKDPKGPPEGNHGANDETILYPNEASAPSGRMRGPGGSQFGGLSNVNQGSQFGGLNSQNQQNSIWNIIEKLPRELRDTNIENTNPSKTPCVILYNLPMMMNAAKVFNLASLFGPVLRVKMLRDKPDTALVQYSDPLYATLGNHFLQGTKMGDHEIQCSFSKNMEVKLPPPNSSEFAESDTRTLSFSNKHQRFPREDAGRYARSACKPTRLLFCVNIPEEAKEEELTTLFSNYGPVSNVIFKSPKKEGTKSKMALVEMTSESDAVIALCNLHGYDFNGRSMKISFSKSQIDKPEMNNF